MIWFFIGAFVLAITKDKVIPFVTSYFDQRSPAKEKQKKNGPKKSQKFLKLSKSKNLCKNFCWGTLYFDSKKLQENEKYEKPNGLETL